MPAIREAYYMPACPPTPCQAYQPFTQIPAVGGHVLNPETPSSQSPTVTRVTPGLGGILLG